MAAFQAEVVKGALNSFDTSQSGKPIRLVIHGGPIDGSSFLKLVVAAILTLPTHRLDRWGGLHTWVCGGVVDVFTLITWLH